MSKVDCEVEYSIDYNAHSCKHDCVVATLVQSAVIKHKAGVTVLPA